MFSSSQSPTPQNKESRYVISFAVTHQHSFIIVSKETNSESKECKVIASFSLYGEDQNYMLSVLTGGAIYENGRIRSDHYFLENAKLKKSEEEERKNLAPVLVKSFYITSDEALNVLTEAKKDSAIKQKVKSENIIYDSDDDSLTEDIIKQQPESKEFTPIENELSHWFRHDLNKNQRGGPTYNGRDYNCKKYAIHMLRLCGIRDASIEKDRYPDPSQDGLKVAYFKDGFWDSPLNVFNKEKSAALFPAEYDEIFNENNDPVKGALALLKDYSDDSLKNKILHPKRHYAPAMRKIIQHIESKPNQFPTIKSILNYIKENKFIPRHIDPTGSLQTRLDYLNVKAEAQENKSSPQPKESPAMASPKKHS